MAKNCGNCLRSATTMDYIPAEKVGYECYCTVDHTFYLLDKTPCDKYIGDIKERGDD